MAGKVKPVPERYHTVTPHLIVKGASEAIDFYKNAFGAEELGRAPGPDGKSIMHAEIKIGDSIIFLNDEFPDMEAKSPLSLNGSPVTIHLYVEDVDMLWKKAVEAGAKEKMPLQDQFWGDRFGVLEDPYGHQWSLATHIEDVSMEEVNKRAEEAYKK
jgi:uncharacterized glyoxalase superfamily protein PhnB